MHAADFLQSNPVSTIPLPPAEMPQETKYLGGSLFHQGPNNRSRGGGGENKKAKKGKSPNGARMRAVRAGEARTGESQVSQAGVAGSVGRFQGIGH